jgi:hypothetical protein
MTRQKWKLPSKVAAVGNFGGVRPEKPVQIRCAWIAVILAPTMARAQATVRIRGLPAILIRLA